MDGFAAAFAPYRAVFSARVRTLLQYRTAALAGMSTQLFFGFVRVMIFTAFYQSSSAAQPMGYADAVTYIWLGQAMLMLIFLHVDPDVGEMIRTGTVAYELVRPVDLYGLWYCRAVTARLVPTLMRCTPILIVAGLFCGMGMPVSVGAALLWLLSTALAVLLSAAIMTLITISVLWTISGEGIARLVPAAIWFFSGIILPLPLFPDWAQPALNVLPFRGLMDVPFRLYIGHLSAREGLIGMAQQVAWIAVFIVAGRCALARGLKRVVVQGG